MRDRRAELETARRLAPLLWDGKAIGASRDARPDRQFNGRNQPAADLRRPGRDRDPERAPVQRDEGGAGAARPRPPRCCRSSAVADRRPAGVREDPGQLPSTCSDGSSDLAVWRRRAVARDDRVARLPARASARNAARFRSTGRSASRACGASSDSRRATSFRFPPCGSTRTSRNASSATAISSVARGAVDVGGPRIGSI